MAIKEDRTFSSINQLAEMTGKSQHTIKKRLAGIKHVGRSGREFAYATKDALAAIYLSDEDGNIIDLSTERALLARSQRAKIDLDVATLEGQRMPTEVVVELCQQLANIVKTKVLAIPSQAKTKIPKLTKKDVTKLETLCNHSLLEISDHGVPPVLRARMEKYNQQLQASMHSPT